MQVTLTGEAVQFTGQDIPGWEIEHLDVALDGTPVRQARQKFPGGEQLAQQGDYIVTLDSGQQIIVHELPAQPESIPEVTNGNPDPPAAGDQDDARPEAAATPAAQAEALAEEGE